MVEEASESLVRTYLEGKDYLVTTNKKIRIKHTVKTQTERGYQIHNSPNEVDIIAVNTKTNDWIIGEVKGWRSGLHKKHFKGLYKPLNDNERKTQRSLRIVNNKPHRNRLERAIKSIYGGKFRIVLFVNHINKKDLPSIRSFSKKRKFDIVTFEEILQELHTHASKFSYSNEPILQLLRIQDRLMNRKVRKKVST